MKYRPTAGRLGRLRLIRLRRRKSNKLTRRVMILLIALLSVIIAVALAYRMDNPIDNDFLLSSSSPETTTTATTTTTTAQTTTAITTPASIATTLLSVGDEYFADACFIGDSRTQGLIMFSTPENVTSFALRGMTVGSFFSEKEFDGKTKTAEGMLQKRKYGKIYIMLGLNELGWSSVSAFIRRYGELIDSVKKSQPNSKIFVQSILPVSEAKSKSHKSFNNPRIEQYNRLIYDMCVQKPVIYLNVREAVEDENGFLPKTATTDGIHMNKAYCDKWLYYLRTHTQVPVAGTTTVSSTTTSAGTLANATSSTTAPTSTTTKSQ